MRKLLTLLSVMAGLYSYSQAICGGQCATLTAGNPQNLGSPQYTLNPGNFSPINGTNLFQVCPTTTSNYTILTQGTNTNNVVVTTSAIVIVTVNPQPVITPTLIQPSCTSTVVGFNLGLTWIPAAPVPGYTITWLSLPNPTMSSTQYSVPTGVAPGTYPFTITAVGGCSRIDSFKLNPPPTPASFSLFPFSPTMSLTCITTSIDIGATDATYNYTWSSNSVPQNTNNPININAPGCYTVVGQNPGTFCTKTITFCVVTNTVVPQSTITPLSQIITCSNTAVTTVSVFSNPTLNIVHYIYDPPGGIFTANSYTAIYQCGPGTYTHCLVNLENGCQICKTFSVISTQGYPTFTLQSPNSFSLGCSTKSTAVINFVNASASTPGAGVTYTIIGPGTGTALPSGTLSPNSTYSIVTPGSFTAIVRELPSFCETRSQFNILLNTAAPEATATIPLPVLDCNNTVTVLQGVSSTPNVNFVWSFIGTPNSVSTQTVKVVINKATPTNSIINTYTLTVTDNSSLCKNTYTTVMLQNLYPPKPLFSLGTTSITCATPTAVLTNISQSGIIGFPNPQSVVGFLWQGPTPQDPLSNSTTYLAYTVGIYTLTAKDLNNGCIASYTGAVQDFKDFPTFDLLYTPVNCGSSGSASVSALANLQGGTASYTWAALFSPQPNTSNKNLSVITVDKSGKYSITIKNEKNGCIKIDTLDIPNSKLVADFAVDKLKGYAPLNVTLVNNSKSIATANGKTDETNVGITSIWNLGNGTYSSTPSTTVQINTVYTQPGTYSLALNVRKGDCKDDSVQYVVVDLPSKLKVPNIFTPNGDKVNDYFFFEAANLTEITCTITDRWGHIVYELTSKTGNILWDGKTQTGVEAAEGVYFYVFTAKGVDGQEFADKGTITLVR